MNASVPRNDTGFNGTLLRALVAGGVLMLLWKLFRGIGTLFWTVFGLAMASFWSGAWRWWG